MNRITKNYLLGALYVALSFALIIFVTVALPSFTFRPLPTPGLKPYSELELVGRKIYAREGCFYCHSQFVRLQDRGMGEVSLPGDYAYDDFNLLGTARTGPDLSRIGGRFSNEWHRAHHSHPQRMNPGSIMPSFSYLNKTKIHFKMDNGKVAELTEMDALIAYLQSLGRHAEPKEFVQSPWEYRFGNDRFKFNDKRLLANPVGATPGAVNSGRGLFLQNCAQCHGTKGLGNGPASLTMVKKPANFSRPFYKLVADDFFYFRIKEGVPGTHMPRWGKVMDDEQIWYLVTFIRTLPRDNEIIEPVERYSDVAPIVDDEGRIKEEVF